MVYANPKLSLTQLPENSTADTVFEAYQSGKNSVSYTNGELASFANTLWSSHLQHANEQHPVFMSLDLETPLGLATFIANNANL